jgi:TPR repeat protein
VNQLFQGVSAAVERATGGRQSPFFVGGGASARLVLNSRPAANTPGSPEGDLPIYAEALKCGTEACLRAAAPKLSAGTMKADLESRLASLSKPAASDRPEDFDPTSMDLKFGVRPEYPEAVQRAIREKEATAAGRRALGQAFLTGAGGFPPDDAQAFYYFVSAQNRGDAAASYYVGQFWETGRKPAAQPSPEIALQQYARAANAGHPEAMTAMGRFHEEGKGGARRDLDVAQSWYRRAAEAGSVEAAQALARLKGP